MPRRACARPFTRQPSRLWRGEEKTGLNDPMDERSCAALRILPFPARPVRLAFSSVPLVARQRNTSLAVVVTAALQRVGRLFVVVVEGNRLRSRVAARVSATQDAARAMRTLSEGLVDATRLCRESRRTRRAGSAKPRCPSQGRSHSNSDAKLWMSSSSPDSFLRTSYRASSLSLSSTLHSSN
ncbi:hypothetical protein HPB51_005486 [Rhipicephalus microplus]|uniref:Uncharacterized protein n=1 Tax=Rhipicephalus microplus TaxID=6941 RepID=A0A9J6EZ22_RHIMP|nr:hypothetical protein HPB51_005486 [Rhipicephalus microplus]